MLSEDGFQGRRKSGAHGAKIKWSLWHANLRRTGVEPLTDAQEFGVTFNWGISQGRYPQMAARRIQATTDRLALWILIERVRFRDIRICWGCPCRRHHVSGGLPGGGIVTKTKALEKIERRCVYVSGRCQELE